MHFSFIQALFPWTSNWPLTHKQAVVLHLGDLDESLLRPGDLYLSLCPRSDTANGRSANDANDTITNNSNNETSIPPELCATWRYTTSVVGVTHVQRKRIRPTDVRSAFKCVTPAQSLTEMLAEELPHLLQSLLVGVEHAINRVPLDELSVFHPSETAAAAALSQHHSSTATAAAAAAATTTTSSTSTLTATRSGSAAPSSAAAHHHSAKLLLSPLGSPKCGLKRREMINKNKLSNKYALKRMTSKAESAQQSASQPLSAGADGAPDAADFTTAATAFEGSRTDPPLSNLPLFCLGRSFPHIDSDEESGDDACTIKPDNGK